MILSVKIFNLFKPFAYFEEYFDTLRLLAEGNRWTRSKLFLTQLNVAFNVIHFVATYFVPMSKWMQMVVYDSMRLLNLSDEANITAPITLYMVMNYLNQLYYHRMAAITDLVEKVLIHQNNDYFLYPTFRGRPVSDYVRKGVLVMISANYFMIHGGVLLSILTHMNFYQMVFEQWDYFNSITGILVIAVAEANMLSFAAMLATVCHSLSIFSMLGVSSAIIMFIQLKQLSTLLYFPPRASGAGRNSPVRCINSFMEKNTITMGYIFEANKIFGKAFLVFILSTGPASIVLYVFLFNGHATRQLAFFVAAMCIQEAACLYGNHLVAAKFCHNIHRPAKRLLQLNTLVQFRNIRDRIKLSLYTMMLHTKNQYGITYGNAMGLITTAAFFKVIMLHSKFVMKGYKMYVWKRLNQTQIW